MISQTLGKREVKEASQGNKIILYSPKEAAALRL